MYFKKVWRILRIATFCTFASALMWLFFGCSQTHLDSVYLDFARPHIPQTSLESTSSQAPIIVKMSFVGDCVLGDYKGASGATFNAKFKEVGGDYAYFSKGVVASLSEDDLSVANLEGVLSDKELQNAFVKPFSFKGKSIYTNILKAASIESVNIANNHTRDYGAQGFKDTREILQNAEIPYFGEGFLDIREIKGKKFGFGGHRGWSRDIKSRVKDEIARLRESGAEVVIFTFHWGEEREHIANSLQREIAYFAIDNGADLIIGHHPHVLQGIEEYKGKKIVYSLGNFIYGGAKNPKDKDTMIYRVEFAFYENPNDAKSAYTRIVNGEAIPIDELGAFIHSISRVDFWEDSNAVLRHSIIPANISSQNAYNDYSPRIYEKNSTEYKRVLKRVEEYSNIKVLKKAR